MDNSSFVEIDRYEAANAFPEKFAKGEKFDCILADLGINTLFFSKKKKEKENDATLKGCTWNITNGDYRISRKGNWT